MDLFGAWCPDFSNVCCVPKPEPVTCESVGGSCLSSMLPNNQNFAPNCEAEYGMDHAPVACDLFTQSCCVPKSEPEPVTCESVGGSCLSSMLPNNQNVAPSCDSEYGMNHAAVECDLFTQSCCVPIP